MYSLSRSFWTVPDSFARGLPRFSAATGGGGGEVGAARDVAGGREARASVGLPGEGTGPGGRPPAVATDIAPLPARAHAITTSSSPSSIVWPARKPTPPEQPD